YRRYNVQTNVSTKVATMKGIVTTNCLRACGEIAKRRCGNGLRSWQYWRAGLESLYLIASRLGKMCHPWSARLQSLEIRFGTCPRSCCDVPSVRQHHQRAQRIAHVRANARVCFAVSPQEPAGIRIAVAEGGQRPGELLGGAGGGAALVQEVGPRAGV